MRTGLLYWLHPSMLMFVLIQTSLAQGVDKASLVGLSNRS